MSFNRDPSLCQDAPQFLAAAAQSQAYHEPGTIEFNFFAHIIQELTIAAQMMRPTRLDDIRSAAEEGMLQIALLNTGCNPGSAFIAQACQCGWRYRVAQGFYNEFQTT